MAPGRAQVGFPRRAPERLSLALQHTHRVLFIRCIRRSRQGRVGKLVGFARATSDGATTATIWDVAVSVPGAPGAGAGRQGHGRRGNEWNCVWNAGIYGNFI